MNLDLNATRVSPEEILYVVKEMARLRAEGEQPDWYSAVFLLFERYKGETGEHEKTFCIMERMGCLTKLCADERMRGWSMDTVKEDCRLTNGAVFSATALCPLRQEGERLYFDSDEFLNLVLRESEAEGRA